MLSNEEVENGLSKEGGHPVIRKPLRQWVLKITDYAERLLEDLNLLDWPEHLKRLQATWIGKSLGANVDFIEEKTGDKISVFTTTPETLFGVTFLVLAPEHPLISKITTAQMKKEVEAYQKEVQSKSDLERTDLAESKTGVWTGAFALNPVNGEKIPIWIADYVLISYGTGAVMGVPAHDARDFEFATKFDIPIKVVIDPDVKNHPEEIPETDSAENFRLEALAGKRCWEKEGILVHSDFLNHLNREAGKAKIIEWLEAKQKGEGCVRYKLRDWIFSRQRYWGEPFPILHFEDGTKRVLDISELPLTPPDLLDFKPSPSGESPLARVKDWVNITDPKTGKKAKRETNTMPNWAGSCWYYLRFCDPHNGNEAWSHEKESYWMAVDLYVGGVEHAVLHLLYARFWHKVLYDLGYVTTKEPFQTLRNQGLVTSRSYKLPKGGYLTENEVREENGVYYQIGTDEKLLSQIEKMSKSKLNGVPPDLIIEEYGTDSLRLYEMFMGPFDKEKVWNTDSVTGCKRFLNRFYDMVFSEKVTDEETKEALKLGHRLVFDIENDIVAMQFNTAIAKMMEFLNDFLPLPHYPKSVVKMAVQVLYPFAPHIAEEAWEHLGGKESLTFVPFPTVNPAYLVEERATYVVQFNGKVRGQFDLPKDQTKEELLSLIKMQPQFAKYLEGEVLNVIYIPNKLINLVVRSS